MVKLTIKPGISALSPVDRTMRDVTTGDPVVAESVECQVPQWLADAAASLNARLQQFEAVVEECKLRGQDMAGVFPHLVEAYEKLILDKNRLYRMAKEGLDTLESVQQEQFLQMNLASNQFADQVAHAMRAVKEASSDQFQVLAAEADKQAQLTQQIVSFVEGFAQTKNAEMQKLMFDQDKLSNKLVDLELKSKSDKRKEAKKLKKQLDAFFDIVLHKVATASDQKAQEELKELAQSVKDGRSIEEYVIGRQPPEVTETPAVPPPEPLGAPDGGVGGTGGNGGAGGNGGDVRLPSEPPSDPSTLQHPQATHPRMTTETTTEIATIVVRVHPTSTHVGAMWWRWLRNLSWINPKSSPGSGTRSRLMRPGWILSMVISATMKALIGKKWIRSVSWAAA